MAAGVEVGGAIIDPYPIDIRLESTSGGSIIIVGILAYC